jgi:hypothetical protein
MRKALVVGVNDYSPSPLMGCVADATTIATTLETHADGSPNFSVKLITSPPQGVTRSILREAIEELFHGDSDVALFYFSGHGFIKSTGGYIVTQDAKKYDEGISMDDVLALANKAEAKERIIILDCCFSGSFGEFKHAELGTSLLNEGLTVLTASRGTESALEVNGRGVFTALVVDALQGGAADLRGHITPGSVYAYVDQALGPWDQRPIFKTNVSRFTSLRRISPPVPLPILRKLNVYFKSPQDEFKLNPSYEFTEECNIDANVAIFKDLQKYVGVGLVVPIGEEHMYFAAINSKSCRLTALGEHYWRLVNEKKV